MSYFYHNKKAQEIWVKTDNEKKILKEIRYAAVTKKDSFFKLTPLEKASFTLEKEQSFIIYNSEIFNPPCSFCKNSIKKIFSDKNCQPCLFELSGVDLENDFLFAEEDLKKHLIDNGYIRTTEKFFIHSIRGNKKI